MKINKKILLMLMVTFCFSGAFASKQDSCFTQLTRKILNFPKNRSFYSEAPKKRRNVKQETTKFDYLFNTAVTLLGIGFVSFILYEYGKLPVQR